MVLACDPQRGPSIRSRRSMPLFKFRPLMRLWPAALVLALPSWLEGCAQKDPPRQPPAPEAGYVVVSTEAAPLEIELSGRTSAFETADVRPQVAGVIRERRFEEGSIVRQGQTLYEIDPSPYRAAVSQAAANLASAKATQVSAEAKADRYKPLAAIEAVSKQDYTDAVAQARHDGGATPVKEMGHGVRCPAAAHGPAPD